MTRRSAALGRELPGWLSTSLILGVAAAVSLFELLRPLRRQRQDPARRFGRNLAMAALSAATIRAVEQPLVAPLARRVHTRGWGLLPRLGLPAWAEVALAVALLDYTLYVWHVLTHKAPFLWRLHRVHHADLDMSASTAVRFHFAEMALSAPWRAAQVLLIGAGPRALHTWQTATLLAILFHHSNLELPPRVERWLCRLLMTPRLHGIHHSIVRRETDSNWSTIFSWPDYVHGTRILDVPQEAIDIGVPEFRDPRELTLGKLVALPFRPQPPDGLLPDGTAPERPESAPRSLSLT